MVGLLHRPPGFGVNFGCPSTKLLFVRRPVDQVEVQVVHLEPFQRFVQGLLGLVIAPVVIPELAGHKEPVAVNPRILDSAADRFLVAVHGGRIDQPVADVNGIRHRLLSHVSGRSKSSVANAGNRHPII